MKVIVVGSGGREHAIIRKLKENHDITEIFALPGNAGIAKDATCVPINATSLDEIIEFAQKKCVDLVVVATEAPLCMGLVDRLDECGIAAFGPRKNAAKLEGSKVFSKNIMKKYAIPTADYASFDNPKEAIAYLGTKTSLPCVVKADGLALGKGVVICETYDEAVLAVRQIMEEKQFGESGSRIIIEEFLTGPEVSVLAFTDGETLVPMVSSMDHKRVFDGDEGLNTGGMGAIAPNPYYTKEIAQTCMDTIFMPTIKAMQLEGAAFTGCLYFGLMLTPNGPKVIEYNCRFGDPEAQAVLPLLKSDLFSIMLATTNGSLAQVPVEFSSGSSCCVVLASGGYPVKFEVGYPITAPDDSATINHFYAGVSENTAGEIVTAGGRVLGVTATAADLNEAIKLAYNAVDKVSFKGIHYRHDIGKKALEVEK